MPGTRRREARQDMRDMSEVFNVSDLKETNPYPDVPFVELNDAKDKNLLAIGAVAFENKSGPGVHILVRDEDGLEFRICTHGMAVVGFFGSERVQNALKKGTVRFRLADGKSQTTGRPMLKMTDWE